MTNKSLLFPACAECGMTLKSGTEYHPYAACLMHMACRNADTVRANLSQPVQQGSIEPCQRCAELIEKKRLADDFVESISNSWRGHQERALLTKKQLVIAVEALEFEATWPQSSNAARAALNKINEVK